MSKIQLDYDIIREHARGTVNCYRTYAIRICGYHKLLAYIDLQYNKILNFSIFTLSDRSNNVMWSVKLYGIHDTPEKLKEYLEIYLVKDGVEFINPKNKHKKYTLPIIENMLIDTSTHNVNKTHNRFNHGLSLDVDLNNRYTLQLFVNSCNATNYIKQLIIPDIILDDGVVDVSFKHDDKTVNLGIITNSPVEPDKSQLSLNTKCVRSLLKDNTVRFNYAIGDIITEKALTIFINKMGDGLFIVHIMIGPLNCYNSYQFAIDII